MRPPGFHSWIDACAANRTGIVPCPGDWGTAGTCDWRAKLAPAWAGGIASRAGKDPRGGSASASSGIFLSLVNFIAQKI